MTASRATIAHQFRSAFYDAIAALYDGRTDVVVTFGGPGQDELNYDDVISFDEIEVNQVEGPQGGTNRSRDVTINQTVRIDIFREGGQDQEKVAATAASEYLKDISEYVRVTDTTLGGLVFWCFLTGDTTTGATEIDQIASGRNVLITATFTARARITS